MAGTKQELIWIRPPQQARSQKTLDRILNAAEALVGSKGYEDASVAEIARRAGSSVGAFYSRFQDKDCMLHALCERYLEQATATADDALDPERWAGHSVAEIVDSVVRFLVEIYRERRGLIRAIVQRNHADSDFQARQERLSLYVSTKLSALLLARREEIGHENPPKAVAFGLLTTFSSIESAVLFGEMRSGDLALSDDDLAQELTRAWLAYLGIHPAPQPVRAS